MTDAGGDRDAVGDTRTDDGGDLARSSAGMAVGTLISRVLGFVRNIVIVAALGTELLAATYAVANTVPNILYILLAGGVLNAVFVPQLVRAMKRGGDGTSEDGGAAYADRLLTLAGSALLGITLVATLAAPLLIRLYSDDVWGTAELRTATLLAYWCLPQIFFYGIYTMLGQVLNARRVFGPFMWAPIANNVVVIVTGIVFIASARVDTDDPASLSGGEITLLGAGTTLGVVLQAAVLVPFLRRAGYRFRPRFDWRGSGLGRAGGLATWTLGFVAVNQVTYLVVVNTTTGLDKAAAALGIDYGVGLAAYTTAYLLFVLPHSVITVSVVTALLPRMSAAAADGRLASLREDFSGGMRLVGAAIVPTAVAFVVLGPELTTVLYAWTGTVSVEGARYIGLILAAFAPGLVAFSAHHLSLRTFYAQEDTRTPFFLTLPIAAVNIALVLVAREVLPVRWVAVGMAGAYSVAYLVGLAASLAVLRRRTSGLDGSRVLRTYVRLLVAATVAGLLGWLVAAVSTSLAGIGVGGSLLALLLGGVTIGAVFVLLARRMRVRELETLVGTVRGRLRR